ncbi:uncharacterized protein GGS25DRAFT_468928 [Hypoxylon fragiforme]|uniref:uncharacterized protein n=1 Tax=Hypoxylon fragiforme TaxID=63214 RepID=UPI0020C63BD8|nr:uncharacterized protein GGS25DRAFT_468928 [Hypoxylon fragiforme]KAI2613793.1 hypothetical protein GGS25DRAFT_468928 [Hypoxylon fragiforme]
MLLLWNCYLLLIFTRRYLHLVNKCMARALRFIRSRITGYTYHSPPFLISVWPNIICVDTKIPRFNFASMMRIMLFILQAYAKVPRF